MSATLLIAGLAISAWSALSHAQPRHHRSAFGGEGGLLRRRLFRTAGWALLAAAFAVSVVDRGWEFGPVIWAVLLCIGATIWVLCHSADARSARWLGWLAALPGLALWWL